MFRDRTDSRSFRIGQVLTQIVRTLDLPVLLLPHFSVIMAQFLIGVACSAAAVLTRHAIDLVLPGAGPFALTMPFILFATLFARWQAGAVALVLLALHAWYYVLPAHGSFDFVNATDGPRVLVNVLSGAAVVALGEFFRRVVQGALAQRDRIAEERLLLLQELDHRVKNNFAIVSSLVRMEIRASTSEERTQCLQKIAGRVDSIARAHGALYRGQDDVGQVRMRPYLETLCCSLADGLFRDLNVDLRTKIDDISFERDAAISVGLVVNELCINAAKHAFVGRSHGTVTVAMKRVRDNVLISVEDDGIGLSQSETSGSQQGGALVQAFAIQAGGELRHVPTSRGTRFEVLVTPA